MNVMSTRDFKSILHERDWFYRIHSSRLDMYEARRAMSTTPLSDYIVLCETLGDGMCQHSPDRLCTTEQFIDVCISLASDILAAEEEALGFYMDLGRPYDLRFDTSRAKFAMTVKYKENKRQWYSRSLQKIGSKSDLRYDNRYEEVYDWANGSAEGALRIYNGDCRNKSAFKMYTAWRGFNDMPGSWVAEWPWIKALGNGHGQAYHAMVRAFDYIEAKREANSYLVSAMTTAHNALEESAVAAS